MRERRYAILAEKRRTTCSAAIARGSPDLAPAGSSCRRPGRIEVDRLRDPSEPITNGDQGLYMAQAPEPPGQRTLLYGGDEGRRANARKRSRHASSSTKTEGVAEATA